MPEPVIDILRGADRIAEELFGHAKYRRKVYHLAATGNLPVFRLGSTLCARRSTLIAYIEEQERQSVAANRGSGSR